MFYFINTKICYYKFFTIFINFCCSLAFNYFFIASIIYKVLYCDKYRYRVYIFFDLINFIIGILLILFLSIISLFSYLVNSILSKFFFLLLQLVIIYNFVNMTLNHYLIFFFIKLLHFSF